MNQPPLAEMDVVYPIRPGDDNEELRFSLRSLCANFPHARVWFIGHLPSWVQGVNHVPGNIHSRYEANGYGNLQIAAHTEDISEWFVIFNDDFYVTEPVAELETLYHCTLDYHINMPRVQQNKGWFLAQLESTRDKLAPYNIAEPLSYELHIPMAVNKQKFGEILDRYASDLPSNVPQCRSLYGNILGIGGRKVYDVKFHGPAEIRKPFHSTEDSSFAYFRERLEAMFPDPCRYE